MDDTLHDQIDGIELTDDERARIDDQGDTLVVTLEEPLAYTHSKLDDGPRTLETLTLPKRVKGKHLKKMDQASGEIGKGLALVAAVAGVPAHAMDELGARDMDLCLVAIEPFLPKRRGTGRR
ncbi:phage tail assembly protein [Halomonas saccharevitans]|uniref:Phage tail assembly chaperone protein, E, or 41 or 14 n=1 Tax=Halomonas saccharevitans TaxID=416872 RepID=A0A1I7AFQ1_9GAMM|nr:phage tail assembly protein [Halomonas saccharevitans]SFT73779.1 Phage tail assembly chaperone protein, E, or 41 or 14 [Halomonas saccharevitans]